MSTTQIKIHIVETLIIQESQSKNLYVNLEASNCFTRGIQNFELIAVQTTNRTIKTVNNKSYRIEVTWFVNVSSRFDAIKLFNILYVCALNYNLILINLLKNNNKLVVFIKNQCLILNKKYNRKLIATITRNKQNKLCQFYNKKIDSKLIKENIIIIEDRAQLWHRRFRHLHYIRLQHL